MNPLDHLKKAYGRGQMSRRDFIRALTGMGMTAVMAGGLASTPFKAFANPPKRGGFLRAALVAGGASDTLNPIRMANSTDAVRSFQIYNMMARVGTDLLPKPELAESWESSPDATEWVFRLRQGVEFHNGKSLTPADIVYSLNLHRGDDSTSPAKPLLDAVTNIRADGDSAVAITLSGPNADLPIVLGDYHFGIVPDGFTDFDNAVGTGAFRIGEFEPGINLIAERNENYWGDVWVDAIETFAIHDNGARASALLSGEADVIEGIDPSVVTTIEQTDGVEVLSAKAGKFFTFTTQIDLDPFGDNHLRLAMKYLSPRERILGTVLRGYGQIGNDNPIAPSDPYFNADLEQRPYDPDRAKYHLKQAGIASLDVVLNTSQAVNGVGVNAIDAAVLYAEAARDGNINIEVKNNPADGYWDNVIFNNNCWMGFWNARPTADLMLTIAYHSSAKWNEARQRSERMDALIEEGRATTDFARRKEIYGEVQRIISDEGGTGIPVFVDYQDGYSSRVKGMEPHGAGVLSGARFSDMVWLDG